MGPARLPAHHPARSENKSWALEAKGSLGNGGKHRRYGGPEPSPTILPTPNFQHEPGSAPAQLQALTSPL